MIDVLESVYLDDFEQLIFLNCYLTTNHGCCLGEMIDIDALVFLDRLNDEGMYFTWEVLAELIDFIPRKLEPEKKISLDELPEPVSTRIKAYRRRILEFIKGRRTIIL